MARDAVDEIKAFHTKVYKGIVLLQNEIEDIEKMDILDDDIWVCSFPRSGTTLTQEMTYLIATGDYERATTVQLDARFPLIEHLDDRYPYYGGLKMVQKLPRPRTVKSHLHHFLLPEQLRQGKGKIIYVARNIKDIICSHHKVIQWLTLSDPMTLQDYFELFMNNKIPNTPWTLHVKQYWENREEENILFLKYEDIIKDMPGTAKIIADFLKKPLTDDEIVKICEHCSLENMRNNGMVNLSYYRTVRKVNDSGFGAFMNKGKAGVWKEHFTEEMNKRIDDMLEKDLANTGLTFEYS